MATKLWLSSTAADAEVTAGAGTKKKASLAQTTATAPGTQVVAESVAGNTAGVQMTDGTGNTNGAAISWYSPPLTGVTITGQVDWSFWTQESSSNRNVAAAIKVERCSTEGAVLSTIVDVSPSQGAGETSTTAASDSGSITAATVTDTVVGDGERLRITVWIDDAADQGGVGTMASGGWGKAWYDGAAGGQGDAWVQFTETLTQFVPRPHSVFMTRTAVVRAVYY